tara:strand:- start:217 stop:432 length:216 start_codon:yes stop_codon:yes gene_type:complete
MFNSKEIQRLRENQEKLKKEIAEIVKTGDEQRRVFWDKIIEAEDLELAKKKQELREKLQKMKKKSLGGIQK